MNRAQSLRRLALWAVIVAVATAVLYLPTLAGGSPWSWHIGEASPLVTLALGLVCGALAAHWWWPRTERWPELECYCALIVANWRKGRGPYPSDLAELEALVRPHVLKREGR